MTDEQETDYFISVGGREIEVTHDVYYEWCSRGYEEGFGVGFQMLMLQPEVEWMEFNNCDISDFDREIEAEFEAKTKASESPDD